VVLKAYNSSGGIQEQVVTVNVMHEMTPALKAHKVSEMHTHVYGIHVLQNENTPVHWASKIIYYSGKLNIID
jgi:hypothetical protein